MKNHTSSLDLYYLVKELQVIVGAKINKVYNKDKDFLFDLFKTGPGKLQLRVILPDFIFLTKYKNAYLEPSKFCMFLRKRLNNAVITDLKQKDFERILEIKLETKDVKYIMIMELFSKGNLILCDENYKIISPFQPQSWQARTIRGGTKYEYPPEQNNPLEVDEQTFLNIIKNTKLDSVVKSLAVDFGLGGVYAELACDMANNDKASKEVNDVLFSSVKELFKQDVKANSIENEVYPFLFKDKTTKFSSFNEAIDEVISKKMLQTSSVELNLAKTSKLQKTKLIIKEQEESIVKLARDVEENKRKAELIFENYQEVNKLLIQLNIDRKKLTWDEVKEKYQNNKIVKQINEKQGLVIVDL